MCSVQQLGLRSQLFFRLSYKSDHKLLALRHTCSTDSCFACLLVCLLVRSQPEVLPQVALSLCFFLLAVVLHDAVGWFCSMLLTATAPCRWSGSMRGAVSVALVYHFFDFTDQSEHVASIIGMTIIVVVFSTMVFGAATKPLLDLMLGKQGE